MENIESLFSTEQNGNVYAADYADSDVYAESVGDYILPDYQPEIRKILLVGSSLLPSGSYESGGRATFGGSVRHHILYSDAEGKLCSVELFSDYDYAFDAGDAASGASLHAKESIAVVNCRLSGPRKLSIRTRILSHIYMLGKKSAACDTSGMKHVPECLTSRERLLCRRFVSGESELQCEVELPLAGECTVQGTGATVHVREARTEKGDVYLRGDAYLQLLVLDGNGTAVPLSARIPFEEILSCGETAADTVTVAYATPGSVTATVGEGEGGGKVVLSLPVTLTAELLETSESVFTVDAYSSECELVETREEVCLPDLSFGGMGHFSVTASARLSELDAADAESVLGATVTPEDVTCRFDGTRAAITGNARVRLLYATVGEDGRQGYATAEYCTPFRGEITVAGEPLRYRLDGGFCDVRCRIDGDAFAVDAEYVFTLVCENERRLVRICEIRDGAETPRPSLAAIVVAYPEAGDSLWEVGKRYRVPLSLLGEVNRLDTRAVEAPASTASLDGVSRLVIVK